MSSSALTLYGIRRLWYRHRALTRVIFDSSRSQKHLVDVGVATKILLENQLVEEVNL